tara:strand:+ start:559 stop:732 length:174 start_codon:yes stop_codon:yes gene_type:complete
MKDFMIWLSLMGISITSIVLIGLIFLENQDTPKDMIEIFGTLWLFLILNVIVLIKDK